jgi:hypothetical protein
MRMSSGKGRPITKFFSDKCGVLCMDIRVWSLSEELWSIGWKIWYDQVSVQDAWYRYLPSVGW